MVDSNTVLWGQTIVYTLYVLAILAVMGWFTLRLTRSGPPLVPPRLFWSFFGVLVVIGVSLHLVTANTIPWVETEISGGDVTQTYAITMADHEFTLPSPVLEVPCDELVQFSVTSDDLTYGFGLFREDNSMVMQMQVVPGHDNDLVWEFAQNGTYSIRSTEYSGPQGYKMIVEDAVVVSGCATDDGGK